MKVNPIVGKVYNAIFTNLAQVEVDGKIYTKGPFGCGQDFKSRITDQKKIRGFDIGQYRYLEQNPDTPFGKKNIGKKIMWVFHGGRYVGKVDNGVVYRIEDDKTTMVGHI